MAASHPNTFDEIGQQAGGGAVLALMAAIIV
jgi:hypothetical protein